MPQARLVALMPADTEEHPERIDTEENPGRPIASKRGSHAGLSTVAEHGLPYPPFELAHRVGSLADSIKPFEYYDTLGRETRDGIVDQLPSDWSFSGKRILDFGCGAGRTLRHFTDEAGMAEFWGCDIDEASIGWMEEHMCPPFHVFVNGPEPPLDQPAASFDLIWAVSVFTHLTTSWSRWLVELHRLLKPDGLLIATFMGRGMSEEIAGELWHEDLFGMNVIKFGQSWDLGGPMVIHSPWWIEDHWGRAFEILSVVPDGFGRKPWLDHGSVLMRKREQELDPSELERIEPGDDREVRALLHNVDQLRTESLELRAGLGYANSELERSAQEKGLLETQVSDLGRELDAMRREHTGLRRETTIARQQANAAREASLASARRLLDIEEVVAQSKARIYALEEALDAREELVGDLHNRLDRADRVMAGMKSSLSWRITAPLRALKPRR